METGKTNIRIKGQIMFSVAIILSGILFLFNFWFIFNSQNCLKASTGYFIEVMTNIVWRRWHRNRFTWSFIKNKRRWLGSWYLKRQGDKLPLLRLSRTPSPSPPILPQQGFVQIWCCHFVGLLCQGRPSRLSTVDRRLCADYRIHVGHFIVVHFVVGTKSVRCAYLMCYANGYAALAAKGLFIYLHLGVPQHEDDNTKNTHP